MLVTGALALVIGLRNLVMVDWFCDLGLLGSHLIIMIGSVSDDISFDALRYALNKRISEIVWFSFGFIPGGLIGQLSGTRTICELGFRFIEKRD